ncbi:MAG: hypothetical protein AB7O13_03505 [Alphaproteobacteria bacterium]
MRRRIARPARIDFAALSLTELRCMSEAGREIRECYRVLAKTDDNIVGEVLRDQGVFREWDHCPENDVFDAVTHSQFYYHAHPVGGRPWAEHGHFHTFLRPGGMPPGVKPADVPPPADPPASDREDKTEPANSPGLCHLVAISMHPAGLPIRLFTTNRWVTGETWYGAADVWAMLDYFVIDHTRPSWALNRWISAMFRLFKPQIVELVRARDRTIAAWRSKTSGPASVYDDRSLEVTSAVAIDIDRQIQKIDIALARLG